MQAVLASLECIAEWKRRLLFIALLAGLGGILWETNDLITENRHHPLISPAASLMDVRHDEFGDPVALPKRKETLPVAGLISSPVTQLCVVFIFALVTGSLFRSLVRGAVALSALILVAVLVVGQENVIAIFTNHDPGSMIAPAKDWMLNNLDYAKDFLLSYLPPTSAAATGLIIGLMK